MTADCTRGVVAVLMALHSADPRTFGNTVTVQRLAGHHQLLLSVSVQVPPRGISSYDFIVDAALDLSPFPVSMEPLLSQLRWHELDLQPSGAVCDPAALPTDCRGAALGVDWQAFLAETCARCEQHFCFDSEPLLAAVKLVLSGAWELRSAGGPIPCAVGYFTAVLIRAKRNAITHSAFASIDAKLAKANESTPRLHVVFHGLDLEYAAAISAPGQQLAPASQGRTVFHTLPVGSLAPFPFDTSALQALLSRRTAVEFPSWQFDYTVQVAMSLLALGIFNVILPGDATAEPMALDKLVGAESSSRMTIFVPLELRDRLLEAVQDQGHVVEWKGVVQLGPVPFESSTRSLPFRVFCELCIYTSIVFYTLTADWVLPLHPWRPCRMELSAVFPPTPYDLGGLLALFARNSVHSEPRGQSVRMEYPADGPGLPALGADPGPCRQMLLSAPWLEPATSHQESGGTWLPDVKPEFNIGAEVREEMTPVDLKMLRQLSAREGLVTFLDKIRLKQWCVAHGIEVPQIYHLSNASPEVPEELLQLPAFVAKPSHLADSSFVFLMQDGVNLLNGKATSIPEMQEGLRKAFTTVNANDWATEHASPGIIVEELVQPADAERGVLTPPDELKCHTVWGELLFCQWVWVSHMTRDLSQVMAQDDWPLNQGHLDFGIPEYVTSGLVFRDGSCVLCGKRPSVDWNATVAMAEGVAFGSDYLRVDMFIKDGRPVLNEVTITFAAIIGFQPEIGKELARRWLEGYQWRASR